MRIHLQRVAKASVRVSSLDYYRSIDAGIVALVGVAPSDTEFVLEKLCTKLLNLRIFEDESKKMTHSIREMNGELLVIPQFTLYADLSKGNRPDFNKAAKPDYGEFLFNKVVLFLQNELGEAKIKSGVFGADMLVEIHNKGPVTILLEKEA